MNLSKLDQRFLDMMDRLEQQQQGQIATLEAKLAGAEQRNKRLEARIAALEELIARDSRSLARLNDSLSRFLGPSDPPPRSDT
ncbi:MAG: hypothetical protein CFE34_04445 [Rhodobacteraceae bacterium PARR1]|nr:MAG: hypothetical protein CFE34_04445 [Rhodobacteraceae bacterium PARR1]